MGIFFLYVAFARALLGSDPLSWSATVQAEKYTHEDQRRNLADCNHSFHAEEDPICCDHLADKTTYQSIRIRNIWNPRQDFDLRQKTVLDNAIAIATDYFSTTLKVRRQKGKLFLKGNRNPQSSARPWKVSSGQDTRQFWELRNGRSRADFTEDLGGVFSCALDTEMPPELFSETTLCNSDKNPLDNPQDCVIVPGGAGIEADLVLKFRLKPCHETFSDSVAYAAPCQRDQCGRPTFGSVTICEGAIDKLFTGDWNSQYSTDEILNYISYIMIHEITHIIGFHYDSFQYFRHSDGSAMVPHTAGRVVDQVLFRCEKNESHVSFAWPAESATHAFVDLGKWGIIQAISGLGNHATACQCVNLNKNSPADVAYACLKPSLSVVPSTCLFAVTTPEVQAMAREFYGCDSIEGMPLENSPTSECVIYSSHWESSILRGEVMVSEMTLVEEGKSISKMTLALLQDSGWYQVDYSRSTPPVSGIHWGYQAGCALIMDKCNENHPSGYFCSQGEEQCSRGGRQKVKCMDCAIERQALPAQWQYFSNPKQACRISGMGAPLCPIFAMQNFLWTRCRSDDHCTNGTCQEFNRETTTGARCASHHHYCMCVNNGNAGTSPRSTDCRTRDDITGFYGEVTGANSYCFISSWYRLKSGWEPSSNSPRPRCFEVSCADDGRSYQVFILRQPNELPIAIGTCRSKMDSINPRASFDADAHSYNMAGTVQCQSPELLCRESHNFHVNFSTPPNPAVIVPDQPDKPAVPDQPDKPAVPDQSNRPAVPDHKPANDSILVSGAYIWSFYMLVLCVLF